MSCDLRYASYLLYIHLTDMDYIYDMGRKEPTSKKGKKKKTGRKGGEEREKNSYLGDARRTTYNKNNRNDP